LPSDVRIVKGLCPTNCCRIISRFIGFISHELIQRSSLPRRGKRAEHCTNGLSCYGRQARSSAPCCWAGGVLHTRHE
jgi:hypothetical protein